MKKTKGKKTKETVKTEDLLLGVMTNISYHMGISGLCATLCYGEGNNVRKRSVLVTSEEFFDYVASKYYELYHDYTRKEFIKDRLQLIRYMSKNIGEEELVCKNRWETDNGDILVNMANDDFQYICVSHSGYKVHTPPDDTPLFVTNSTDKPMKKPVGKDIANIKLLDDMLNLTEDDKFFLKIWLVSAMNPEIRTPILYFLGNPQTGKTSMERLVMNLIDPSTRDIINWDGMTPKELAIIFDHGYFAPFDNVSKIDQVKSDVLCQAITGGTKVFRKLYTNGDEDVYELSARVAISSVRNCITQPDLASRTYYLNVPVIPSSKIDENRYDELLQDRLPKIMGGLLTLLSSAISQYDDWYQNHHATYRLANFELFGGLVASILDEEKGYERFLRILRNNYTQQIFLEDDKRLYFEAMLEMIDEINFEGKMKELHEAINMWIAEYSQLPYEEIPILDYGVFSRAIHYYAGGISSLGYDIEFYKSRPDNYASVRIKKREEPETA